MADSHAVVPAPLSGLRVLDFGVGAVGVEVGRLFAEYGADVIKIESRTAPDFIRSLIPGPMNPPFASSSRSKRSFGVDLKTRRGVELLEQLVPDTDLLVDNNGAGVMERLGLGFERLRQLNPRLIVFTSQIVGAQGPWREWTGYGPSTHAVSGLQYLWNYPEDRAQPAGSTNIYPDHLVGRVGGLLALAGLIRRERSGRGANLDAAQFETPIQLLADWFALESLAPGSVGPQGNRSPRGAPWGCYPCAGEDEWCVINVRSDDEWRSLVGVLGDPRPAWALDSRFDTAAGRHAHADELDGKLSEWTAEHSPQQVRDLLQQAGVPAGDVQHVAHQLADPQLAARGYARVVDQPGVGTMLMEGPAFRGTGLPDPRIDPAPLLGEHTREIARERLGLSDPEIDALIGAGVLQEPEPLATQP
ncbi:MAG: CaiB/BaiF CoA transferase family protein [Myxococcota bacterium]